MSKIVSRIPKQVLYWFLRVGFVLLKPSNASTKIDISHSHLDVSHAPCNVWKTLFSPRRCVLHVWPCLEWSGMLPHMPFVLHVLESPVLQCWGSGSASLVPWPLGLTWMRLGKATLGWRQINGPHVFFLILGERLVWLNFKYRFVLGPLMVPCNVTQKKTV